LADTAPERQLKPSRVRAGKILAGVNITGASGDCPTRDSDARQRPSALMIPRRAAIGQIAQAGGRSGPDGGSPNDVERADVIVAAKDIVATDAWAAKEIFSKEPGRLGFIQLADEMGLGRLDYAGRVEQLAA
jgi:hypothetical protein